MPHLTVHALESDLAGREAALVQALTECVVEIYGEWARESANVQLIGIPRGRWAVGGEMVESIAPSVTFGIREAAFARPDATDLAARLIAAVTDAVVSVFGEHMRSNTQVELVATPAGRTGVGGVVV